MTRTALLLLVLMSWQAPPKHDLVARFYQQRDNRLFWFASDDRAATGRARLLRFIDSAAWLGLDSNAYHPDSLRGLESAIIANDRTLISADRQFTAAALSLAADCRRGRMDSILSYDGVSPSFTRREDSLLLAGLGALSPDAIDSWLTSLNPTTPRYAALKAGLAQSIDSNNTRQAVELSATLNTYRFIHHFGFDRFIIVNIPSAMLYCYSADTLSLSMRVVAGQPSKRTPRFAAWCTALVLYPYWNIPHRIAVNEFLPLLKHSPGLATLADIQVIDDKGTIVDPTSIDWKKLNRTNFPYALRQAPGCGNALGVLKFELTDPFNVYMHDTNLKRAFGAKTRYLSHGCIRLENPTGLGGLLLDHHLDTSFLAACLKDQKPKSIPLAKPVPVFVVYLTAIPDSTGSLRTYKDIYHLFD
jgi:murein L,D-transpeptidase YcbB/YkuD